MGSPGPIRSVLAAGTRGSDLAGGCGERSGAMAGNACRQRGPASTGRGPRAGGHARQASRSRVQGLRTPVLEGDGRRDCGRRRHDAGLRRGDCRRQGGHHRDALLRDGDGRPVRLELPPRREGGGRSHQQHSLANAHVAPSAASRLSRAHEVADRGRCTCGAGTPRLRREPGEVHVLGLRPARRGAERLLQLAAKRGGALVAILRALGERLQDRAIEPSGDTGCAATSVDSGAGRFEQVRLAPGRKCWRRPLEGRASGEHGVEDGADGSRDSARAGVAGSPARLLRGEVRSAASPAWCPARVGLTRGAGPPSPPGGPGPPDFGEAEVEELDGDASPAGDGHRKTLADGFRSRWTMPAACAAARPSSDLGQRCPRPRQVEAGHGPRSRPRGCARPRAP